MHELGYKGTPHPPTLSMLLLRKTSLLESSSLESSSDSIISPLSLRLTSSSAVPKEFASSSLPSSKSLWSTSSAEYSGATSLDSPGGGKGSEPVGVGLGGGLAGSWVSDKDDCSWVPSSQLDTDSSEHSWRRGFLGGCPAKRWATICRKRRCDRLLSLLSAMLDRAAQKLRAEPAERNGTEPNCTHAQFWCGLLFKIHVRWQRLRESAIHRLWQVADKSTWKRRKEIGFLKVGISCRSDSSNNLCVKHCYMPCIGVYTCTYFTAGSILWGAVRDKIHVRGRCCVGKQHRLLKLLERICKRLYVSHKEGTFVVLNKQYWY